MKVVASIQARLGSKRLPGKVLKNINGKSILMRLVERLRRVKTIDDIIVATTINPDDDAIVKFCIENNINYFRGSENDVLDRIASMIDEKNIDVHVECFGDSPLLDPQIVDEVVGYFLKHYKKIDFVSNSLITSYPPGQEVIVYRGDCLIQANKNIGKNNPLREHVSIHISKHSDKFRLINLKAPTYYNYPNVYLELDTAEDFKMIKAIFNHFDSKNMGQFSLKDILDFLGKNPELVELNNHIERRWKEFREDGKI
jgi:spore coat polysaccharide biosynthesis protein SpsF